MEFNEQVLLRDTQHYVMATLNYLVLFLQMAIPMVSQFSTNHPRLFVSIIGFIMFYFTWTLFANFVRVIKRLFYLYMLVIVLAIYLRGFQQFFTADLPLIWSYLRLTMKAIANTDEYAFIKLKLKLLMKHARRGFD